MTLKEFENIPSNMNFTEYNTLIENKNKLHKKIKQLNAKIIEEEDYISVLTDDEDVTARNIHQNKLIRYLKQKNESLNTLDDINKLLGV